MLAVGIVSRRAGAVLEGSHSVYRWEHSSGGCHDNCFDNKTALNTGTSPLYKELDLFFACFVVVVFLLLHILCKEVSNTSQNHK